MTNLKDVETEVNLPVGDGEINFESGRLAILVLIILILLAEPVSTYLIAA